MALTVYDNDDKVFRALCAGASGYLLKNTPPARLLESLREVAEAARRCRRSRASRASPVPRFPPPAQATYRPDAAGTRAAEAARRRPSLQDRGGRDGHRVNTVSFHLKHIYEKLQVHSKTEAVAKALRERLI